MRDPVVPTVGSVLDDDQPSLWAQHPVHRFEDRLLVAEEMQRVRHHDPIEVMKVERPREVCDVRFDGSIDRAQCARVLVDGRDVGLRPEQVGQRAGEVALTGAEVGPASARLTYSIFNECYEIGVIQRLPAPLVRPRP